MIRRATSADIPALIDMGRQFAAAAGEPFEERSFVATISGLLKSEHGVVLVVDLAGRAEGVCVGLVYPLWFAAQHKVAQELLWWVNQSARGPESAALVEEAERWAQGTGAEKWLMVQREQSDLRPDAVGRLYRMRGYARYETSHVKLLKG